MEKADVNDFQISSYFNLRDFCSPDTFELKVSRKIVEICEKLRECGPLRVVSAYRNPEYNKKVGGAENSYHLQGKAVHLKPTAFISNVDLFKLASQIPEVGGLGLYESKIIHIDLRPNRAYWVKALNDGYRYLPSLEEALECYEQLISSSNRKSTPSLTRI